MSLDTLDLSNIRSTTSTPHSDLAFEISTIQEARAHQTLHLRNCSAVDPASLATSIHLPLDPSSLYNPSAIVTFGYQQQSAL